MIRWYRLDGRVAVPLLTDAERYAEWEQRQRAIASGHDSYRVARTDLPGGRFVSTVFLGLDHNYMPDGPPLLFETMVFPECDFCERYSTWEQAVAGHDQISAAERENQHGML